MVDALFVGMDLKTTVGDITPSSVKKLRLEAGQGAQGKRFDW